MIDGQTKHCSSCDKDLPATEEYFYPSHLRDRGRNQCKSCHAKKAAERLTTTITYRDRLREIAQQVEPDERPLYQSLNSVAKALGWSVAKVEHDVYERQLPVFTFIYNNVGPALALKQEAAVAYVAAQKLNGHGQNPLSQVETEPEIETALPRELDVESESQGAKPEIEAVLLGEPQVAGTPDECASCGTTKGNILAVLDEKKVIRAYLCSPCYRTASSYKWEPNRMRRMADLIESIGIQRFTV